MEYRRFGATGWLISEIGLGTYPLGGDWGETNREASVNLLREAFDLGVDFYDTADVYGAGESERLLGEVFSGTRRSQVRIATKGGRDFYLSKEAPKNWSTEYLEIALVRSLERLKTDYIDVYQLHNPDISTIENGEAMTFLQEAKAKGQILAAGLSLHTCSEALAAIEAGGIDTIQYRLNALQQGDADEALTKCRSRGIAVIIREPLAQGLLTGKYDETSLFLPTDFRSRWSPEFRRTAAECVATLQNSLPPKLTMAQAALGFVLSKDYVSVTIPGARTVKQLKENILTPVHLDTRLLAAFQSVRLQPGKM